MTIIQLLLSQKVNLFFASRCKKIAVRTVVLMVPNLCLLKVSWYQKM